MDSIALAVEKLKGFAKGLVTGRESSSRCNPVLKVLPLLLFFYSFFFSSVFFY